MSNRKGKVTYDAVCVCICGEHQPLHFFPPQQD